ncbi:MAG: nucleotidyltransferase domain-containing protein [Parcubacteria group bacterium]|jgi:predicted nucleotidyltransferase
MLDIKSKITQKLLTYYFANLSASHYVNELARMLEVDPGNLDRKLRELELEGLFVSEKQGNLKFFKLNKNYPLLEEVRKWYKIKYGLEKRLKESLEKLIGLKEAYIFGSYAKGNFGPESDIDMLLIGSHSSLSAKRIIAKMGNDTKREFNIIDLSEKELLERKKKKDEFVENIFKNKIIKII